MVTLAKIQQESLTDPRRWANDRRDGISELEARFSDWMTKVIAAEESLEIHVYNNPDCSEFDLRQHRYVLYGFLASGEGLAIDFMMLGSTDTAAYVRLIDQKLSEMQTTLFEWHGPVEGQEVVDDREIPESFKAALKELRAGEISEMDFEKRA